MKPLRLFVAVVALALCALPRTLPAAPSLLQLRGLQEVKSWFNAMKGHPRLILLLSPT